MALDAEGGEVFIFHTTKDALSARTRVTVSAVMDFKSDVFAGFIAASASVAVPVSDLGGPSYPSGAQVVADVSVAGH